MVFRLLLGACVLAPLLLAAPANASQIAFDGHTVTYVAAPSEVNQVSLITSEFATSCGSVATPCLLLEDSYARVTAFGGCAVTYLGLGGTTIACPIPQLVRADLGDNDDAWWDWDGPSTIDGGAGNDNPIFGRSGDDVIHGGSGNDLLFGEAGNDTLDGGTGDDDLEGVPGGTDVGLDTSGADTYIGGGGGDSLTYERRSEDLSLSPDGVANDGAPGEGDNIAPDITTIIGGNGNDTLTGNAGRNVFAGSVGDDVLTGGTGDDRLYGGNGNDRLDAGPGTDYLEGDDGDDTLTGGPDVDEFYGEAPLYSYAGSDRIFARDGNRENVHCGNGIDSAEIDRIDYVTGTLWGLDDHCEGLDVAGADGAGGSGSSTGTISIAGITADRKGRLIVRLALPSAGKADLTATARIRRRTTRIARARRTTRAPGKPRLTLKPTSAAKRALRHRALKVTVRVSFTPTGGKAQSVRKTATLRAPR